MPAPDNIPEERAHAALKRAAELQAEAALRLEEHARVPLPPGEGGAGGRGFLRTDVEAAAAEAGIAAEYVRQALIEQETLGEHAADLAPWIGRMADRWLRTRRRSLEVSRTMSADPPAVLAAMQRVFSAQPYGMTLVDTVGGSPLEGGVLVFQLPQLSAWSATGWTPFSYTMKAVDLLHAHVSLREVAAGGRAGCEVTLRADLRVGLRRNVFAGLGSAGTMGALGAFAGGVVGTVATGGLLPVALAGAGLGALGLGAAGGAGYGSLYRHYLRKAVTEFEMVLRVVDANARTGGAFRLPTHPQAAEGMPPLPPPLPPG